MDAIIREEGDRLIVELVPPSSTLALLATLQPTEEDIIHKPVFVVVQRVMSRSHMPLSSPISALDSENAG
jgi:hypothetical protein